MGRAALIRLEHRTGLNTGAVIACYYRGSTSRPIVAKSVLKAGEWMVNAAVMLQTLGPFLKAMFLFSPLSLDSQILFIDGFDGVLRIRRGDVVTLNLEVFVLHWVEIVAGDFHG
jgi:hypothetical protein